MLDKVIENNRVCIIGEIVSEFTFSHEVFGEGFYIANVSVNRLSDMVDVIPLMISERLIDVTKDYRGMKIEVAGQFRSYNRHEGTKNKLVLSIFVRELRFFKESFLITIDSRLELLERDKHKLLEFEQELREKYNQDNIFKNKNNSTERIQDSISTETAIVEYKEKNFIQKLFDKIKHLFRRNN